jgi:hypothetical protein
MKSFSAVIMVGVLLLLPTNGVGATRLPNRGEVQELFDLAVAKSRRCKVSADIICYEIPWSAEQVAAELKLQSQLLEEHDRNLSPQATRQIFLARSNATFSSHSGFRTQHVREYRASGKYRQDLTDEVMAPRDYLGAGSEKYHLTFVNTGERSDANYHSYTANHDLRDVLLSRNPDRRYAEYKLWQAFGIDETASVPLLIALMERTPRKRREPSLETFRVQPKIDPLKLEQICSGQSDWHLDVCDEKGANSDELYFKLTGKLWGVAPKDGGQPALTEMPVQVDYWIGKKDGKSFCRKIAYTNLAEHVAIVSAREDIDSRGLPHRWIISSFRSNVLIKEMQVRFTQIDLQGDFLDEEVFPPHFPSDYSVGDATSGQAKILQNPNQGLASNEVGKNIILGKQPMRLILMLSTVFPVVAGGCLWVCNRIRTKGKPNS